MRYFLGVDTGSSKTHALIADDTGRALGFSVGGPGNPRGIGYDAFTRLVEQVWEQARSQAGVTSGDIAGAGFGIGGYNWASELPLILDSLAPLGWSAPICVVNDATLGIIAGAREGWGVGLVAGSGCNCRGWDRERREGRVTGFGILFDEGAGSAEVIARAVQAVNREWSRRGPATALTPALVEYFGVRDASELLENISLRRINNINAAAPVVFGVARAGDPLAREIVAWAGRALGDLAAGVIRQLEFEKLEFDLVLVGSMFKGDHPLLMENLRESVFAVAPLAQFIRLTPPPVVGAVLLGMEQAGINPWSVREHLIETTNIICTTNDHQL